MAKKVKKKKRRRSIWLNNGVAQRKVEFIGDLARRFDAHESTIRRWHANGWLPPAFSKPGARLMWDSERIDQFVRGQEALQRPPPQPNIPGSREQRRKEKEAHGRQEKLDKDLERHRSRRQKSE